MRALQTTGTTAAPLLTPQSTQMYACCCLVARADTASGARAAARRAGSLGRACRDREKTTQWKLIRQPAKHSGS